MDRYYRKIIRIRAEDSPNVKRAFKYIEQGLKPPGEVVLEGVLSYPEYKKRRSTWDAIRQCVGLDGNFYEGSELLLFPPLWLDRAERLALQLRQSNTSRKAKAIGIDPGEGGANTAFVAVDEVGVVGVKSIKTPDTSVIPKEAKKFWKAHGVDPAKVVFDRGGGGKQHADTLRADGYPVTTVAFGEGINLEPKRGLRTLKEKIEHRELKYTYKNRRAQMYSDLRDLLDPTLYEVGFAIPPWFPEFRLQLSPIPLWYDSEGVLYLPPKNRKPGEKATSNKKVLSEIIGHSPDEADALVLAVHGLLYAKEQVVATGW